MKEIFMSVITQHLMVYSTPAEEKYMYMYMYSIISHFMYRYLCFNEELCSASPACTMCLNSEEENKHRITDFIKNKYYENNTEDVAWLATMHWGRIWTVGMEETCRTFVYGRCGAETDGRYRNCRKYLRRPVLVVGWFFARRERDTCREHLPPWKHKQRFTVQKYKISS